jgi:hypothetical protein
MKPAAVKTIVGLVADSIETLRTVNGIAGVTREHALECAKNIVQGLMPWLSAADGHFRMIADSALKMTSMVDKLGGAGDSIMTSLEAMLEGHPCDHCGRLIGAQGGARIVDGAILLECGACDGPKKGRARSS